jgi:hypothetical protein
LVTSLEKNPLSRIEDTAFDVAGEVLVRPAQAGLRSFRVSVSGHDCFHDGEISPVSPAPR